MSSLIQNVASLPPTVGQRSEDIKTMFAGRITATSSGAAQTLYTTGATVGISGSITTRALLRSIRMMNLDSSTQQLSLYIVPAGQSIGDDYRVTPVMDIAANTVYHETGVEEVVEPGSTIQAYASTTNVIVVRLTGSIYQ